VSIIVTIDKTRVNEKSTEPHPT